MVTDHARCVFSRLCCNASSLLFSCNLCRFGGIENIHMRVLRLLCTYYIRTIPVLCMHYAYDAH